MKGEQGSIDLAIPRDRQGTFEPHLVKKGHTRLDGFDDKILSLYARGMTTRDIQAQLLDLSGIEVSPTLISNVTEAEAEFNLELFAEKWDALSPSISTSWRTHWARVIPLFAFPKDIRKVIYTTNATPSMKLLVDQLEEVCYLHCHPLLCASLRFREASTSFKSNLIESVSHTAASSNGSREFPSQPGA